ncbi:MAG: hypothetical protein ACR2RE_31935 [Geminicoccaceae bacterium]
MMDTPALATSAVALLAPYLVKGSEAFAKKVGDAAFAGVGKLSVLVKEKLTGRAEEALADLEKDPNSEDNQADLRKQLKKAMEEDQAFAEEIRALVEDVKAKGGDQVSQIMNVTGDNNQSYQISGSGNVINT